MLTLKQAALNRTAHTGQIMLQYFILMAEGRAEGISVYKVNAGTYLR
jgi:hypothetical protein